jgi:RNA polymerase sigma-70 factor (subfamily 1)
MSGDDLFAELYARADGGDARALDELLVAYLPRLRAFVRARMDEQLRQRESASDLVQSVCRELVAARPRFEFRGEAQFRGWLFTAALNKVREKRRFHGAARRDRAREAPGPCSERGDAEALASAYATVGTPSAAAIRQEDIERLERAFDQLSEDHREVITLTRLAGLPQAQVAVLMGRSAEAVQKLLGRAMLRLGELLEQ